MKLEKFRVEAIVKDWSAQLERKEIFLKRGNSTKWKLHIEEFHFWQWTRSRQKLAIEGKFKMQTRHHCPLGPTKYLIENIQSKFIVLSRSRSIQAMITVPSIFISKWFNLNVHVTFITFQGTFKYWRPSKERVFQRCLQCSTSRSDQQANTAAVKSKTCPNFLQSQITKSDFENLYKTKISWDLENLY